MERVAVIGAGVSGISAAYELKKKGYKDVVVFEKENRVGGKCSTVDIEGRNYELGAVITGKNSCPNVINMVNETGISIKPLKSMEFVDSNKGGKLSTFQKAKLYLTEILPLKWTVIPEFEKLKMPKDGYKGMDNDELSMNFSEWLNKKGFQKYQKILSSFYTTWGYGYFEDTPAAYIRKFLTPERISKTFVNKPINREPNIFYLEEGYQKLCEKVVDKFNINTQLNTNINSIERKNGKVTIKTDKGEYEFDKLILTTPFNKALNFLDVTPEEKELMSKTKYREINLFTMEVEKLPNIEIGFILNNLTLDKAGSPFSWYKRWDDSNVVTFYSDNPNRISEKELYQKVQETVKELGGEIKRLIRHDTWEYAPHVLSKDIREGFYDKLDSIQGKNNTIYSGEILAFPSVETSISHSKDLVNKMFPKIMENTASVEEKSPLLSKGATEENIQKTPQLNQKELIEHVIKGRYTTKMNESLTNESLTKKSVAKETTEKEPSIKGLLAKETLKNDSPRKNVNPSLLAGNKSQGRTLSF